MNRKLLFILLAGLAGFLLIAGIRMAYNFWMTFLGSLACVWPHSGLEGMPRRYIDYSYSTYYSLDVYELYREFTSVLLLAGLTAQLVFLVNVVYSMAGGRKSVD